MKSLLSLCLLLTFSPAIEAKTIAVTIEAMKYSPSIVEAKIGDTIEWDNKDFFPHTVTALNKSFNSAAIPSMKKWTTKVKKSGTFKYQCQFHPVMKGTLKVIR